ncbi:hypothetical protein POM88_041987 [Heracleum sosnowskyi]|uniref:DUF8039 domain-containing protein n=1 Tax=Heracleum sosnowskyi TaxID=360622 RepID=A0AAD8HG11_9APIA|nr:hypothetical protein POM88_041987 [Heracleum sosnowskyi]
MDEEDDYKLSYSRNDHDEGEYVNLEFFNVHGHERSKPNTKRKRKRKSNKWRSGTDGSKDVNVTEERSARRGIVNMLKVKKARNKSIVQTVNWNQLGQPIGKESVTLVHFVGSYARRNVPIICDDWRKKEWQNVKQNLWDEVKIQEKINAGVENPTLSRLDAWEYARRDAGGKINDPVTLQILQDLELKWKGCKPEAQSRDSSHMDNFDMDNEVSGQHDDDHDLILGEDLPQGENPCYLYLDPGRRYVGQGMLHNDPNDRILHGISLEEGYVMVQFEVAEKSECKTQLPRPCDDANLVGEAPGYFLAWPANLVSMKLEVGYTPPRIGNKEKVKHAMGQNKLEYKENKKLADKEKAKTS